MCSLWTFPVGQFSTLLRTQFWRSTHQWSVLKSTQEGLRWLGRVLDKVEERCQTTPLLATLTSRCYKPASHPPHPRPFFPPRQPSLFPVAWALCFAYSSRQQSRESVTLGSQYWAAYPTPFLPESTSYPSPPRWRTSPILSSSLFPISAVLQKLPKE